jgi:hypothetical protein
MTVWSLMARCPVEAAVPEPINPIPYARDLARPVRRGLLALPQAQAGLRATCHRLARQGQLAGDGDPEGWFAHLNWVLCREIDRQQAVADTVGGGIGRRTREMIRARRASNEVRAAAHDINGAAGFALTEREVEEIVAEQVYWALPRELRHG